MDESTQENNLLLVLCESLSSDERRPSCFDSLAQFRAWVAAARAARDTSTLAWCEDCTPAYQEAMIEAGRCARPYVQFTRENGYLEATMAPSRRVHWLHVAQKLRDGTYQDCPDV